MHEKLNFLLVKFWILIPLFLFPDTCFVLYTRDKVKAQTKHKRQENRRDIERKGKAKDNMYMYLKRKKMFLYILLQTTVTPLGIVAFVGKTLTTLYCKFIQSNYAQILLFNSCHIFFLNFFQPHPNILRNP